MKMEIRDEEARVRRARVVRNVGRSKLIKIEKFYRFYAILLISTLRGET